jgi:hypothetical protein
MTIFRFKCEAIRNRSPKRLTSEGQGVNTKDHARFAAGVIAFMFDQEETLIF